MNIEKGHLEEIWKVVPPDYYQKGVKKNILQRLWHNGKLRAIVSLIEDKPSTILDVGCASGWFLSRIAKRYPRAKCTGIDVYSQAIAYGKKRYKLLKFVKADGHKIPFPTNSFDVVVCCEVLEHVVDPKKVCLEIKRVLKKNGTAIIEMDTGNWLFKIVWYWWTHLRRGVWKDAHIQVFTAGILEKMLRTCGFTIKKKKTFNVTMAVAFMCKK